MYGNPKKICYSLFPFSVFRLVLVISGAPSVDACYRKLYILCIESRYLPNNTHNNKHTPMNMYDIRPVLLSLRRMLALSLSVGNYSTAESWRSLLAPRCWRCACCLFSFGLSLARCFSSDFTRSFLITPASVGVMISNFNWPSECRVSWVNREFRTMRGINTAMLCRYSTDCGNVRAIRRYSYGCARVIITAYTRRRPLGVLFSSVSKRVLTYPCARDNVLL